MQNPDENAYLLCQVDPEILTMLEQRRGNYSVPIFFYEMLSIFEMPQSCSVMCVSFEDSLGRGVGAKITRNAQVWDSGHLLQ